MLCYYSTTLCFIKAIYYIVNGRTAAGAVLGIIKTRIDNELVSVGIYQLQKIQSRL